MESFYKKRKEANKIVGNLGEALASEYFRREGFQILDSNVRYPYAELDIITFKTDTVHFVEVKTVRHETRDELEKSIRCGYWRPEELVDAKKVEKLKRAIHTWILRNCYTGNFQLDVVAIRCVIGEQYCTINTIENLT